MKFLFCIFRDVCLGNSTVLRLIKQPSHVSMLLDSLSSDIFDSLVVLFTPMLL